MRGRVKGLLGGGPAVDEPMVQTGQSGIPQQHGPVDGLPGPATQHQALQILTLAQRTAEEHIANARRQADKVGADARAAAEQIVREAQAHAHRLQQEADRTLADSHAAAAQIAQDAQAHAEGARQHAEEMMADAQAEAEELVKNAQADADELEHRAQQRYDDVVGSLAARREALQQQIEALEQFDRDYRARLTAFMQSQLRALWADQPHVVTDAAAGQNTGHNTGHDTDEDFDPDLVEEADDAAAAPAQRG
jgi:cell division septum initiation protein DivIVA